MASTYTFQTVIDGARLTLNDPDKVRCPDTELLVYANDALLMLEKKRPDMFLGSYTALPGNKALGDTFPVPDQYVPHVRDYIVARAEFKDDEFVQNSRAQGFFALFNQGVFTP